MPLDQTSQGATRNSRKLVAAILAAVLVVVLSIAAFTMSRESGANANVSKYQSATNPGENQRPVIATPSSPPPSSAVIPNENRRPAIAVGQYHSLALDKNGKVYATGDNSYGQLGLGNSRHARMVFTPVSSLGNKKIVAIAAGDFHSLALDDLGRLYATGFNRDGQLGLGNHGIETNRENFTLVSSLKDKKIVMIEAGKNDSFAIDSEGKLYAVGDNEHGQLGMGKYDREDRDVFTFVASLEGKKIVAISTSYIHSLALDDSGKVYAAGVVGDNEHGLGDPLYQREVMSLPYFSFTPVSTLNDNTIVAVKAGYNYSLALEKSGKIYAAGGNEYGYPGAGDGNLVDFTLVADLSDKKIVAITMENLSTPIVLDSKGKLYAASVDAQKQLESGDVIKHIEFTPVSALVNKRIVAVAAGEIHSLALDKNGKIYAKGRDDWGQLGFGDIINPAIK
ncbi:MAG: hypothetical protein LBO00_06985 [Zoogloeaceae bacterium]|jgi:alpha-tubulin suppressor-like RCC1 family protein|nr:hypothetical protein [Zoogloeaceae bacterium]